MFTLLNLLLKIFRLTFLRNFVSRLFIVANIKSLKKILVNNKKTIKNFNYVVAKMQQ